MMSAPIAAWGQPTSTKKTPRDPLLHLPRQAGETKRGSQSSARDDLTRIFTAAVRAVDPYDLVRSDLIGRVASAPPGQSQGRFAWLVVGAGKAAARMAAGCEAAAGADRVRGLVITADACSAPLASIACVEAGHPVPDERGHAATTRLCALLEASIGPVVVLISGGASALLIQPPPPITLEDKMAVNQLLLRCGASIEEVNSVRKHLSMVKGGGLLRACRSRPLLTLIVSDVVGDDPSVVGSGPTFPDPSTYADALHVLRRHRIDVLIPAAVRLRLEQGERGEIEETVKPGAALARGTECVVLGNNRMALDAAAVAAESLGYRAVVINEPLIGDTCDAARAWLGDVKRLAHAMGARPWCVIAGGETTVAVKGPGRGGRNQEFALALVDQLAGCRAYVLSAGSDGIDGPTDAAGAFVDGDTAVRARRQTLDPTAALTRNDSYTFFDSLGDLFRCGPTATNVMDIKIALGPPGDPSASLC